MILIKFVYITNLRILLFFIISLQNRRHKFLISHFTFLIFFASPIEILINIWYTDIVYFTAKYSFKAENQEEIIMLTDIEIAQSVPMRPITEIAQTAGIPDEALDGYAFTDPTGIRVTAVRTGQRGRRRAHRHRRAAGYFRAGPSVRGEDGRGDGVGAPGRC